MSREPLVLIHGFSGTRDVWEPVLPALQAEHDVLAETLAGHHGADPIDDPSVERLADAVERDMDRAGYETAHIAGNSLGGWLSLVLAKRGRARSVVAIAPAGGWEGGSKAELRLQRLFRRTHQALRFAGPQADVLASRPGLRKLALRDTLAHPERMPPHAAAGIIRGAAGCDAYLPFVDAVRRDGPPTDFRSIDVPVRVAWGTGDRILTFPRYWEPLKRILPPDAELVELPGLGHVPMWDDPGLIARTVLDVTARRPVAA